MLEYCSNNVPNFKYKSCGELKKRLKLRLERICYCRNLYLDFIKRHYNNDKYLLLIIDFDNVTKEFSLDIIKPDIIKYKAIKSFKQEIF